MAKDFPPGAAHTSSTRSPLRAPVTIAVSRAAASCTVLPEENGGVTEAFLRAHPEFTKEEFTLPGVGTWGGDVTLWPQRHGTDGFYICRMRRRG